MFGEGAVLLGEGGASVDHAEAALSSEGPCTGWYSVE